MVASLLPHMWCSWNPWSVCSVEPCRSSSHLLSQKREEDRVSQFFCLDHLPGTWKHGVYQLLETGEKVRVSPERQRRRSCQCKTVNFIKAIFQSGCKCESTTSLCYACLLICDRFPPLLSSFFLIFDDIFCRFFYAW